LFADVPIGGAAAGTAKDACRIRAGAAIILILPSEPPIANQR